MTQASEMKEDRPDEQPWQDPIVAEVRRIREALFAEAGYDIHEFCRRLSEKYPGLKPRAVQILALRDDDCYINIAAIQKIPS